LLSNGFDSETDVITVFGIQNPCHSLFGVPLPNPTNVCPTVCLLPPPTPMTILIDWAFSVIVNVDVSIHMKNVLFIKLLLV
jgi:hypothetical protein